MEFKINNKYFINFESAAAYAIRLAAANNPAIIDTLIYDEKHAFQWGGDAAVEQFNEDPEASVFERIEIKVTSHGRVA